nr:hypothetical protein [Streptomyces catenulae]
MRLLHALVGDAPDGLLLVGDGQQSVHPGGFRLADAGIDIRGDRGQVLRTNYRLPQQQADPRRGSRRRRRRCLRRHRRSTHTGRPGRGPHLPRRPGRPRHGADRGRTRPGTPGRPARTPRRCARRRRRPLPLQAIHRPLPAASHPRGDPGVPAGALRRPPRGRREDGHLPQGQGPGVQARLSAAVRRRAAERHTARRPRHGGDRNVPRTRRAAAQPTVRGDDPSP